MLGMIGRKNRIGAALTAVILFASLLFMLFFLSEEAMHECQGEHCEICFCMEFCEGVISQLKDGAALELGAVLALLCFVGVIAAEGCGRRIATPVSLKVRINI